MVERLTGGSWGRGSLLGLRLGYMGCEAGRFGLLFMFILRRRSTGLPDGIHRNWESHSGRSSSDPSGLVWNCSARSMDSGLMSNSAVAVVDTLEGGIAAVHKHV